MDRQAEPGMRDPDDKDIHKPEGRDPYPDSPKGVRTVGQPSDDTVDPATRDPQAPHDRGSVQDGEWRSGTEDAEAQLADEGEKKAWKKGLTQNAPPRPQNSDS